MDDDRTRALRQEELDAPDSARLEELEATRVEGEDSPKQTRILATDATATTEPISRQIGRYFLIKKIGEGGMGEVWKAEQHEPIRRTVALKVVKRGLDTGEFIARFESERQALALMDHPNIAKVLDAGTTPRGRPYFVMEYVAGSPITKHCDDRKLGVRERLELFVRVCQGLQHAHQKAIIHRDIKPSNVLVTVQDGAAVPKIIDFGVAKALGQQLTNRTLQTNVGQIIGTLDYMSPEQASLNEANIDTRTDVYSLGGLLYRMLTGRRPFEADADPRASFTEILRRIQEDDPRKPTVLLRQLDDEAATEIATQRGTNPAGLVKMLRGDLNWIVMRALEKDRARRYATVDALMMDVERHLRFEPVLACPPSRIYRTRRFVRRHRIWVAASTIAIAAVLLGIAGTTVGLVRARRAERIARSEAETARQVSGFMVDLFEVSDPDQARGQTITAREILDAGATRVREDLAHQPPTQARLMHTIGKVYRKLGLYEEASPQLEEALALRRRLDHDDGVEVAELAANEIDLADLYIDLARYDEATALLQEALVTLDAAGESHRLQAATSLNRLASVYRRQGRYDEAAPLYARALAIRTATLGPDHPEVARSYNSLAILARNEGRYDDAEQLYKRALAIREKSLGADHPDVAQTLNNLAFLYHHQDDYAAAEPLYTRAAAIWLRTLGERHPRTALALNNLGLVHHEQGQLDLAEPLYRRALAIREEILGPDHHDVAQTVNNLGNLHRERGELETAETLYRRALAIREKLLGPNHPDVAWSLRDLGKLYAEKGQFDEAEDYLVRAAVIMTEAVGSDHADLAQVLEDYGDMLEQAGRTTDAALQRRRAVAILSPDADRGAEASP